MSKRHCRPNLSSSGQGIIVIPSERSERGDLHQPSSLLRFSPAACCTNADCFDPSAVSMTINKGNYQAAATSIKLVIRLTQ